MEMRKAISLAHRQKGESSATRAYDPERQIPMAIKVQEFFVRREQELGISDVEIAISDEVSDNTKSPKDGAASLTPVSPAAEDEGMAEEMRQKWAEGATGLPLVDIQEEDVEAAHVASEPTGSVEGGISQPTRLDGASTRGLSVSKARPCGGRL